jgi:serine/threonine protein kinase, bacterial
VPLGVGEVFAGYTVVRLLGSGGMGEVYLVKHPRLPRQDALKVLPAAISNDADFRTRFEREADLAATLWHPHIVGVHDRGEDDGRLWIAMDYVEGSDAAQLSREQFPHGMPARDVAEIVAAVAEALDYAHDQQLLHRDVKPGNILLDDDGTPFIADFGLAKDRDASVLTKAGTAIGSMDYMAPEQIRGEEVSAQTDVYALGCVMYECLSGKPPFADRQGMRILWAHLQEDPPDPLADRDDVPADVAWALKQALAKEPEQRPPTATAYAGMVRIAAGA